MSLFRRLVTDESGASHIEYALIAAFTGTALTGALFVLKDGLSDFYVGLSSLLGTLL